METQENHEWVMVRYQFPEVTPAELLNWWTDPRQLTRWWPQVASMDIRPGGHIHLSWPSANWHLRGEILEYTPAESLQFTWFWDHTPDEPVREVSVKVTAADGGTTLNVAHGPFGDSAAEQKARQENEAGWNHFLTKLTTTILEE